MELGNMIFGNSRGEAQVPRDASFGGPWEDLRDALGISYRGYAEGAHRLKNEAGNIETHVFVIRPYDWDAECDCGAGDRMTEWYDANPHAPTCYQTELRSRLASWEERSGYAEADRALHDPASPWPGMQVTREEPAPGVHVLIGTPRRDEAYEKWRKLNDHRRKVERALFDELGAKYGVDPHYGAAVHCTCGRDERGEAMWVAMGGHESTCRFVQPNFLYKPTGFRINWYKYPFRDAYMTPPVDPEEWRRIVRHCIESAAS